MSIEAKHAYRFGYLKSEQWANVRLEALAREKAKCQICGEESLSNDAHHMWYPDNIYETREFHLVILCRPCHDFIHAMIPECKTSDEEQGRSHWLRFFNAIKIWRDQKKSLFEFSGYQSVKALRDAYHELKKRAFGPTPTPLISEKSVLKTIKMWAEAYREKNSAVDNSNAES